MNRLLCDTLLCKSAIIEDLSEHEAVVNGWYGIGVVSFESGPSWFQSITDTSKYRDSVALGPVRIAMDGEAFAIEVRSTRATTLGAREIKKVVEIVVFSRVGGNLKAEVPAAGENGDFDYALSPDASNSQSYIV